MPQKHEHDDKFETRLINMLPRLVTSTGWPKKVSCKLLSISLPNINWSSNIFHRHIATICGNL